MQVFIEEFLIPQEFTIPHSYLDEEERVDISFDYNMRLIDGPNRGVWHVHSRLDLVDGSHEHEQILGFSEINFDFLFHISGFFRFYFSEVLHLTPDFFDEVKYFTFCFTFAHSRCFRMPFLPDWRSAA